MSTSTRRTWLRAGIGLVVVSCVAILATHPSAQQLSRNDGYIDGTVASSQGPEAGVWVIAETKDLPTPFIKIVVTDDQGRFMVPELPNADYSVWVRGYGLLDSTPVNAAPGATLALKAQVAGSPQEAAKVYPANYWYSLIEVPGEDQFPGTGPEGNGISPQMRTQNQFVDQLKQGCQLCHQLGNEATRTWNHLEGIEGLNSHRDAWDYRIQIGQRGAQMNSFAMRMGRSAIVNMYADWTERIANGEVPPAPPRPSGVERNVVVTLWDWGVDHTYSHDEVTTAKAKPTVNSEGKGYGVSSSHGKIMVVDPLENSAVEIDIPTRDDPATMRSRFSPKYQKPSPYWGEEIKHSGVADPHNPMMDLQGRLWMTSTVSQAGQPDWCSQGELNKYAEYYPLPNRSSRHASYYDPSTGEFALIYTCFGTHHLQFGEDEDQLLYFSGAGPVIPWVNTKLYDETGDEQASQGWCPTVLDTNGDGVITKPWNEPAGGGRRSQDEGGGGGNLGAFDPKLDTRVNAGSYGVIVSPTDQSAWAASTAYPGRIVRLELGDNPPETCKGELYTLPDPNAFGPRGIDVDRNGVIWTALSGSGGFASLDRRKCKVFSGPEMVDGQQCAEGWTIYPLTVGPKMRGTDYNADFHYYNWVDQFNTSGLGPNLPVLTGSGSDSLRVLKPETKEWVTLRVPYPMGFFSRGNDGRIDDPDAGWKGRGLWSNYATNFVWHTEGGKGTTSKMVHFQVRLDPLAR